MGWFEDLDDKQRAIAGSTIVIFLLLAIVGGIIGYTTTSDKKQGFEPCSSKIEQSRPYDYNYMKTLYRGKDCGCGCDGMVKAEAAKTSLFGTNPVRHTNPPKPDGIQGMSGGPSVNLTDPRVALQTATGNTQRIEANDISRELAIQREMMATVSPVAKVDEFVTVLANRAAKTGTFLERDPVNAHQDSSMTVMTQKVRPTRAVAEGINEVSEFRGMRSRPILGKK